MLTQTQLEDLGMLVRGVRVEVNVPRGHQGSPDYWHNHRNDSGTPSFATTLVATLGATLVITLVTTLWLQLAGCRHTPYLLHTLAVHSTAEGAQQTARAYSSKC